MGDVINLARARKRRQREAAKQRADANALAHGRRRSEKLQERLERAHQQALLDGARMERDPNDASTDASGHTAEPASDSASAGDEPSTPTDG